MIQVNSSQVISILRFCPRVIGPRLKLSGSTWSVAEVKQQLVGQPVEVPLAAQQVPVLEQQRQVELQQVARLQAGQRLAQQLVEQQLVGLRPAGQQLAELLAALQQAEQLQVPSGALLLQPPALEARQQYRALPELATSWAS